MKKILFWAMLSAVLAGACSKDYEELIVPPLHQNLFGLPEVKRADDGFLDYTFYTNDLFQMFHRTYVDKENEVMTTYFPTDELHSLVVRDSWQGIWVDVIKVDSLFPSNDFVKDDLLPLKYTLRRDTIEYVNTDTFTKMRFILRKPKR